MNLPHSGFWDTTATPTEKTLGRRLILFRNSWYRFRGGAGELSGGITSDKITGRFPICTNQPICLAAREGHFDATNNR